MNWIYFVFKSLLLFGLVFSKPYLQRLVKETQHNLDFLTVLSSFFVFALASSLIVNLLSWIYRRRKKLKVGNKDNVLVGLENVYYIILTGAVILSLLGVFGIDYKALFTSLSIVAAAIAIISKDYISEVISGIIMSFSNDFSIGDYVSIAGHKGKIVDLHLTRVELLNEDDDIIFIPNNKVFSGETINFTKRHLKKVSVEFEIDQKYLRTVEELESDLIISVSDYAGNIIEGTYNLKIVEIKKDSISFKFQYVLFKVDRDLEKQIRKKTVRKVVNFINAHREEKP